VAVAQGQHGRDGAKSGEGKGSADQCTTHRASVRPRGGATSAQWLGEQAEAQARRGLPGGGRRSLVSGELVDRLGQQAGAQTHVVLGEGLGVLKRDWGLADHQARRGVPMTGRR
jgi:hypothetical protein